MPDGSDVAAPRHRQERRRRSAPPRELTYEPDTGRYEATIDLDRVADVLGGRVVDNAVRPVPGRSIGATRRIASTARVRDRRLRRRTTATSLATARSRASACRPPDRTRDGASTRTLFIDLETTGLSGGAGTVAFLVGCGWFDSARSRCGSSCSPATPPSARCSARSRSSSTAPTCSSPTTARRSTCR